MASSQSRVKEWLQSCIAVGSSGDKNGCDFASCLLYNDQSELIFEGNIRNQIDLLQQIIRFNNPKAMVLFILFENPVGYALFELNEFDQVNTSVNSVQSQIASFQSFSRIANLKEFFPFESSTAALEAINSTNSGKAPEVLINFLSEKLPMKKKSKVKLGVSDNKLAGSINQALEIQTTTSAVINELIRGFRTHFLSFLKSEEFENLDLNQSRLGLAHLFSRNKISLDVNRNDKPIIQSINLIELLDKDINTFSMRVKEWYSWHYPELAKIITDNQVFVRLAQLIGNRESSEVTVEQIEEICGDGQIAEKVLESCKNSMGQEISEFDIQCLGELCDKTLKMYEFRKEIQEYLKNRMEIVSPNLTELIGETVAAKLIAHSGSLSTLAKYPASTIQILGAEKALFRALKEKAKTPKYGLLYNTSFIGRAIGKTKGKISRYLANKCAMAARLDHFLVNPTNKFGQKLKEQVEKRLEKVDENEDLEKNEELMDDIVTELRNDNLYFDSEVQLKKALKKKKKAKKVVVEEEQEVVVEEPKKKKKIAKA